MSGNASSTHSPHSDGFLRHLFVDRVSQAQARQSFGRTHSSQRLFVNEVCWLKISKISSIVSNLRFGKVDPSCNMSLRYLII